MQDCIVNCILNMMSSCLNNEQLLMLQTCMGVVLSNYSISNKTNDFLVLDDVWKNDLRDYLLDKKIGGKSQRTLKQYKYQLTKLLSYLNKSICQITQSDIYEYMIKYKAIRKINNRSMENMRLIFSSFFNWEFVHKRILDNPMILINRIKYDYKIKKPFDNEELEKLFCNCKNERDSTIIGFLYSSCIRVSELISLNRGDIKISDKELTVYGKGGKERIVYINAKTCVHLKNYLNSRVDDDPALFVSLRKPHHRLTVSAVESTLRKIGEKSGIENVHPHRFRRTGATNALNRGMPVEEVSTLLGHSNISTTQLYCTVSQNNIKISHGKYLSA